MTTYDVDAGGRPLRLSLIDAERRLTAAGVPSPRVDAELLAAHVLGVPRGRLLLTERFDHDEVVRFESLLARRLNRVPLQHLVGTAAFRDLELEVGPGVMVPRPETELVAEAALQHLRAITPPAGGRRLAVDLCSGSGALAFSLATECDATDVVALEASAIAQRWARGNLARVLPLLGGRDSTVLLRDGDVMGAAEPGGELADLVGQAHVVVSNPPYIPDTARPRDPEVALYDPPEALYGGPDGLDVVRGVVATAAALLVPGGLLVVEHGDAQGDAAGASGVPSLVRGWPATGTDGRAAFTDVVDRPDLNGRPRFTTALRAAP